MSLIQEIRVPLLAVNDASLSVVEISFETGAKIKSGDKLMVLETSKTTYDVIAETDGFIEYFCQAGIDYDVNQVIARIFSDKIDIGTFGLHSPILSLYDPTTSQSEIEKSKTNWLGETLFSHEAIRLINSNRLDKSVFSGMDMVCAADVKHLLGQLKIDPQPRPPVKGETLRIDSAQAIIEKLSLAKKREINYLSEVQHNGLPSTIDIIIETTGIFGPLNKSFRYFKDSLLPIIIYESSRLLSSYPKLNAYFTSEGIGLYNEINIGFAIDLDLGLKVVKIASADRKSIHEVEEEMMRLSNRYLDNKLDIDDLTAIGFTITDLSSVSVFSFQPLVNIMNSAILGISSVDERFQRCMLSLTFDHRVTEGKTAARFLSDLKKRLESYRLNTDTKDLAMIRCNKCMKGLNEETSDTGFVKYVDTQGIEGYICQACLNGF
jgi:pyruvate/2-oxoglutarate dehydrogenase complex dihydrolipoamide acyltransferase (E2) component